MGCERSRGVSSDDSGGPLGRGAFLSAAPGASAPGYARLARWAKPRRGRDRRRKGCAAFAKSAVCYRMSLATRWAAGRLRGAGPRASLRSAPGYALLTRWAKTPPAQREEHARPNGPKHHSPGQRERSDQRPGIAPASKIAPRRGRDNRRTNLDVICKFRLVSPMSIPPIALLARISTTGRGCLCVLLGIQPR